MHEKYMQSPLVSDESFEENKLPGFLAEVKNANAVSTDFS